MNRNAMEKLLNATFECDHSNQKMTHYSNLTWEQTCEECGEIIKSGTYEKSERGQILTSTPQDEPVAMRYDFDGYGYKYIDSGSGSDWRTRIKDAEPVFDRPQQRKPLWIDPNDKTQAQFLPHIGEPVLFCHGGKTYYGRHTGGSFQYGAGVTKRDFNTWECHWMPIPAAHGIKGNA